MSDLLKQADPDNLLNEIRNLRSEVEALKRSFIEANNADEAFNGLGEIPIRVYDPDTGVLIFVQSSKDLFEEFGVHANMISFSPKGVIQFYVSFTDGKIYGVLTMDEIKYVIDLLVNNGLAERFFRIGTRDNGTTPEGVAEYGGQETPESITNADFDSGLDNWNVLSQAYTEDTLNTALPTGTIQCMCVDANGNIYVGFWDGSGVSTSSVWWWNGATWAALGTLSTAFNILAITVDSNGNVFAGGDDLTTSRVWKWNGSTWAAHGTLSTSFTVQALIVDSNDRLYAGTSNGTTSNVWYVDDGSTTWAALGTLSFNVRAMVKDASNNIYVTGGNTAYARKWDGATWAIIGGASTGNQYYGIDIDLTTGYIYVVGDSDLVYWDTSTWTVINSSLFSGGNNGNTILYIDGQILVGRDCAGSADGYGSYVVFSAQGNIRDFGSLSFSTSNEVFCSVKDSSGNIYIAGDNAVDIIKYTLVDSWDASNNEYVEITASELTPALALATRFAVTAGEQRQVKGANYIQAIGGIGRAKLDIEFWTAVTGGTLVSTVNIFSREFDDAVGALQELSDIVTVPATATHATLVLSAEVDTATEVTVRFDDFQVREVTNFVRLFMNDDGLFASKNGRDFNLLNRSENFVTDRVVNIDTTGVETTLFDEPVDASWLLVSENFIRWSLHVRAQMTTSRSCTFRVYLGGTVILTWSKGGAANIVELFDIDGKLVATGNNSQIAIATEKFMNVTGAASALSIYNGTGAKDNTVENNLKITAQFSGSLTSAVAYGVQVEKVNGVI